MKPHFISTIDCHNKKNVRVAWYYSWYFEIKYKYKAFKWLILFVFLPCMVLNAENFLIKKKQIKWKKELKQCDYKVDEEHCAMPIGLVFKKLTCSNVLSFVFKFHPKTYTFELERFVEMLECGRLHARKTPCVWTIAFMTFCQKISREGKSVRYLFNEKS